MKITQTMGIASALLLVTGCAHEEYSARTDESVSPGYGYSSGRTEYNTHNNFSSAPSAGGYSGNASGTYSTGNGGAYSGGVSTGSQSQSDNTIVAQVRAALERDPEIAFVVPNIQISANNGAIMLNGHVQSEEQKRQILSKVQQVTGVATVNNQLEVMPGLNGPGSSGGPQMNPTGGSSGADRLYKDASNGRDNSTNNALNPTSRENSASQLYRESNQENRSTNSLNPTSLENGSSQIYQGNPGENSDTNSNRQ